MTFSRPLEIWIYDENKKGGNIMKKIFDKLEEYIGGALFIGIFIILVLQVFFRQVLHTPLIWSEELSRLIFVWVAMLGISIGIRKQSHIFIDFYTIC